VLHARSLHFGFESGGVMSKADIHVADQRPQSHTAYGLKERSEISVVSHDILTNKKRIFSEIKNTIRNNL
jgi:hypothetical protein